MNPIGGHIDADGNEIGQQPELFDIHVMLFAGDPQSTVDGLERHFAVDREAAERLIDDVPIVVMRAAEPDVAAEMVDVLGKLGAQVVLLPAASAVPVETDLLELKPPSAPPPPLVTGRKRPPSGEEDVWAGFEAPAPLARRPREDVAPVADFADLRAPVMRDSGERVTPARFDEPGAARGPEAREPSQPVGFETDDGVMITPLYDAEERAKIAAQRAQRSEPIARAAPRRQASGPVHRTGARDLGLGDVPPLPDLGLGYVPPLPALEVRPDPAALAQSPRPALPTPPSPVRAAPPPPPSPGGGMRLPSLGASSAAAEPIAAPGAAPRNAGDGYWSARRAAATAEQLDPEAKAAAEHAAKSPAARRAARAAMIQPEQPSRMRELARPMTELVVGVLIFGAGIALDRSVLFGNASVLMTIMHGFALYGIGSGIAGLRS